MPVVTATLEADGEMITCAQEFDSSLGNNTETHLKNKKGKEECPCGPSAIHKTSNCFVISVVFFLAQALKSPVPKGSQSMRSTRS